MKLINFNKTYITKNDFKNVKRSLKGHISGVGPFTKKVENLLEKKLKNSKRVLFTTSCTHALEIAAILLNLKKNDEVIVPAYTFVSTALPFYMNNAKIVLADIKKDTLNIDENKIEKLITKKTKAIVVVHYSGVGCEMKKIMSIANKFNIKVIEDNAHGLFGTYKNKLLGTIGHIGTLSFHATKNFTSGEGGAIILNDKKYIRRAEIIRDKGTDRFVFLKSKQKKFYEWVDKGSSYVQSDILAALLLGQMQRNKLILEKRKKVWNNYYLGLLKWVKSNKLRFQKIPKYCGQTFHVFSIIFNNAKLAKQFLNYLQNKNITAKQHYTCLSRSKFIRTSLKLKFSCPISRNIASTLIRLPLYPELNKHQTQHIIQSIKNFKFR